MQLALCVALVSNQPNIYCTYNWLSLYETLTDEVDGSK